MMKLRISSLTKTIIKSLILILLLPSCLLFAGEKVDKIIDVDALEKVNIQNSRGKVVVEGWDENKVKVFGELDDLTEKFVFSSKDKVTTIKIIIAEENQYRRSGKGSNITVFVPKGSNVEYEGVSTSLNVSKINHGLSVKSISGKITLNDIHENINISNNDGDITAVNISGKINISSVSGKIDIKADSNNVKLKTISSDIIAKLNQCYLVNLSTVSGVVKLHGKLASDGQVVLTNVTGESYYYASKAFNSKVLIESGPDGKLVNEYSNEKPVNSLIESKKLLLNTHEGKANLKLFTVSGIAGVKLNK